MKRRAALLRLSREHHGALVLALRIGRAEARRDTAEIAALMRAVTETFERELEPHFIEEEAELLPRLQAAGEHALVQRTLDEHRELRALAARIAAGHDGALQSFGVLLNAHVRFEERDLFNTAEAVLPAAVLDQPGAERSASVSRTCAVTEIRQQQPAPDEIVVDPVKPGGGNP